MNILNISTRKIGGLRFVKIGRFCFSFCITRQYRPIGSTKS
ncbi:MAG: hypothetical protein QG584_2633 [Pseudomonadota bacterium]|nr:hypothetical protein [Pseudomonadota bacterium]